MRNVALRAALCILGVIAVAVCLSVAGRQRKPEPNMRAYSAKASVPDGTVIGDPARFFAVRELVLWKAPKNVVQAGGNDMTVRQLRTCRVLQAGDILTYDDLRRLDAPPPDPDIGRDGGQPSPQYDLLFRVEGLECPAAAGLGWGGALEPVLAHLDTIEGVERSYVNYSGSLIRLRIAPAGDRAKVAAEAARILSDEAAAEVPSAELQATRPPRDAARAFNPVAAQDLFVKKCSACHSLKKVSDAPPTTELEARDLVRRMVDNGMLASEQELDALVDSLVTKYVKGSR
jgi:mono/diheme cytochrome c family protein